MKSESENNKVRTSSDDGFYLIFDEILKKFYYRNEF